MVDSVETQQLKCESRRMGAHEGGVQSAKSENLLERRDEAVYSDRTMTLLFEFNLGFSFQGCVHSTVIVGLCDKILSHQVTQSR